MSVGHQKASVSILLSDFKDNRCDANDMPNSSEY